MLARCICSHRCTVPAVLFTDRLESLWGRCSQMDTRTG
nr:MAG TPA: hypothetical protein [Bacteriophage sp.]